MVYQYLNSSCQLLPTYVVVNLYIYNQLQTISASYIIRQVGDQIIYQLGYKRFQVLNKNQLRSCHEKKYTWGLLAIKMHYILVVSLVMSILVLTIKYFFLLVKLVLLTTYAHRQILYQTSCMNYCDSNKKTWLVSGG